MLQGSGRWIDHPVLLSEVPLLSHDRGNIPALLSNKLITDFLHDKHETFITTIIIVDLFMDNLKDFHRLLVWRLMIFFVKNPSFPAVTAVNDFLATRNRSTNFLIVK